jgi:hypothetical protein
VAIGDFSGPAERNSAMPETEGLGKTGWAALAILVLCIALVVVFGFAAAIYIGLIGTAAALTLMVVLCLGDRAKT